MPPRIRQSSFQSHLQSFQSPSASHCQCLQKATLRLFSSTLPRPTRQRRIMFRWLTGPGAVFKDPLPGSTNYLNAYDRNGRLIRAAEGAVSQPGAKGRNNATSDDEESGGDDGPRREQNIAGPQAIPKEQPDDLVPFPMNRQFRSQPVLSEDLKDEIWTRIMVQGKSVKVVSAELGVEMRRVGAVVRLKAVENQWIEKGQRLATPYAKAVLSMLPQTPYHAGLPPYPHEPINDLPVHRATLPQIFYPVAESRHFTRADAGKVFARDLLPAEARIPHPELVQFEQLKLAGLSTSERVEVMKEKMRVKETAKGERKAVWMEREAKALKTVVPLNGKGRAEFRFRDISVESVGKDGRGREGVGARYGMPHEDRKRGIIKIPTKVE